MATRRQIALFEAYRPGWQDTTLRAQVTEVPTMEQVVASLDGGVSDSLGFSDYLERQPARYQRQVFPPGEAGKNQYEAWKRGDIIITSLPPQSPIAFATLQRRSGALDADVVASAPIVDPTGTPLPRSTQARIRANAANAPTYAGNRLLSPSDVPAYNFDALSAYLTSLTPEQVAKVLPKTILASWKVNPTAGGLVYANGRALSWQLIIKRLNALFTEA